MITMNADICLILEGTYPYVSGGVSSWTHELISRLDDHSFHLLAILPPGAETEQKYDLPKNILSINNLRLQHSNGTGGLNNIESIMADLEQPLVELTSKGGGLGSFRKFLEVLQPYQGSLTLSELMDSHAAWELVQRMYERSYAESSFLDYFWSWRALMGSLFSIALADIPRAELYHTVSTGYAGLAAARAKIEFDKPVLITEHGIYTNERRIEIASADWLEETAFKKLTIDPVRNSLRDFWVDSFNSFSSVCYESCDEIVTLFKGNQTMQLADGADPEKLKIIPNGVDVERFEKIQTETHEQATIALIGRVVPIKDIKSFIRAVAKIAEHVPDVRVYVMGPTDEDITYYQECRQMTEYMGLSDNITFTGQVNIERYLPQVDVCVLSSISEAMPLVLLEAGACGIPTVATDVGACRDIICGMDDEEPNLGDGGAVVPLSNPSALAEAVIKLIKDKKYYKQCSDTIRKRVQHSFNKVDQIQRYRSLYDSHLHGTHSAQATFENETEVQADEQVSSEPETVQEEAN